MERMTLHEAQTKVAAICKREGWGDPKIDWANPIGVALSAHVECLSAAPLTRKSIAWREIRDILLAYHAHTVFEAGKAFADQRSAALARKLGAALAANMIRDGLHYAEEVHQ